MVRGVDRIFVELNMKPAYRREMIDSALQLFRSNRDHSFGWLTMVPAGDGRRGDEGLTVLASTSR